MRILFSIGFVLCSLGLFGHQLRGKISNSQNESLVGVSIYIENSTYGVVSNFKGEYFMELKDGVYVIVYQYLGYEIHKESVTIHGASLELNVVLRESDIKLSGITVTANKKDPAYAMMRLAIEKRDFYFQQIQSYECTKYIKASLEKESKTKTTDSLTLKKTKEITKERMNMLEWLSHLDFEQPAKYSEEIFAFRNYTDKVKSASANSTLAAYGYFYDEPQSYDEQGDDEINSDLCCLYRNKGWFNFYQSALYIPWLYDLPYQSPLGGTSFLSYDFHLETSFIEDGKTIHKIAVIPKRKGDVLFEGTIYLVDEEWAIKGVDFALSANATRGYTSFRILQNYTQSVGGKWVMAREEYFYESAEESINYIGNTQIQYFDYQIDTAFEKGHFNNAEVSYTKDAVENADRFFKDQRPITLKMEEINFIQTQDSLLTYHQTPEYMAMADSSYNRVGIINILFSGVGFRNSLKGRTLYFIPLVAQPRLFTPGGYRHAFGGMYSKYWIKSAKQIDIYSQLDYGFLNRDLRGHVKGEYTYNPFNYSKWMLGFGSEYELINQNVSAIANLSPGNYAISNHFSLGFSRELVNGVFAKVKTRFIQYQPVDQIKYPIWMDSFLVNYQKAISPDLSNSLLPQHFDPYNKLLLELEFVFKYRQTYILKPNRKIITGTKYPLLLVNFKSAIPGVFGSVSSFGQLQAKLQDKMKLGSWGISQFSVTGGFFMWSNAIFKVDKKYIVGADYSIFTNPMQAFQHIGPSLSTTKPYFETHYRHMFNGALMNKIPVIRKMWLSTVVGGNLLLLSENKARHIEGYFGIEKRIRIGKELFKIGFYNVYAESTLSNFPHVWKLGFTYYNSYKGQWEY